MRDYFKTIKEEEKKMTEENTTKYEIADGCYISNNRENEYDKSFTAYEDNGKYWHTLYFSCNQTKKYVTIKEEEILKAMKQLRPESSFKAEDVVRGFAHSANFSKPRENPEINILKLEKSDKTAIYFSIDRYSFFEEVTFLREDLSLDKPENLDKIKAYSEINWCKISATNHALANKMSALGYNVEHYGRSGFESRNVYIIKTKDDVLTPEIYQKMQQDLQNSQNELNNEKKEAFDIYFDENSPDSKKVYSLVETGYDYHRIRTVDSEKYETIAQMRTACTMDSRQGQDHTYLNLMINVERIKKDKRNFIVFEVPQDMIGMVVGKGGKNIKKLEETYGKKFKVVQSTKEKEAQKQRQHQEDLQKLQKDVIKSVGDYVLIASEQDMQKAIVDYMEANKQNLPFIPSVEELNGIYTGLCSEKERKIAEQQRLEAERIEKHQQALTRLQNDIKASFGEKLITFSDSDIAQKMIEYMTENKEILPISPNKEELEVIQKNLEKAREEKVLEQKRQDKEATETIFKRMDNQIYNYSMENQYELPTDEEIKKGIAEFLRYNSNNPVYERVAPSTEKEIILMLQKERYKEQVADKKFDETTSKVLEDFFNSEESGGHGRNFFSSVGKARRASGYNYITDKVMTNLGFSNNENTPLPMLQEHRYEKYREKIIEFEENYSCNDNYNEYSSPEPIEEKSIENKEPTLENLAAIWGAKLKGSNR